MFDRHERAQINRTFDSGGSLVEPKAMQLNANTIRLSAARSGAVSRSARGSFARLMRTASEREDLPVPLGSHLLFGLLLLATASATHLLVQLRRLAGQREAYARSPCPHEAAVCPRGQIEFAPAKARRRP